jgi:putative MATE family efflux protein
MTLPFADSSRPLWRVVASLALPVLAQQALVLIVTHSDRFLAGHFEAVGEAERRQAIAQALGSVAASAGEPFALAGLLEAQRLLGIQVAYQAAQTTANYLTWMLSSYAVLVSAGSTALVARCIGAGRHDEAIQAVHQSLLLAVGMGTVGGVIGLATCPWWIAILDLRGDAARFAVEYLAPLFALLPFQMVETAGIACLVGAGDTLTGLRVMGLVAFVNVPVSWGLCLGLGPLPRLGFVGISLGTALSHALGGLTVAWILRHGRTGLGLEWRRLWPDGRLLVRLLRVSIPAGLDSLSVVAGQLWFLRIVNGLGDVAGGAHGIALAWEAVSYLAGAAFGTAAMALVGQALGAGRYDLARRAGWVAFGLGCSTMSILGAGLFVLAPWLFLLYCPQPSQQPVVELGVPVLRLVAFAMPALASAMIFTQALRGAGDARVPLLFTWVGFLGVRIPLAYWLTGPAVGWGLWGAWLAMCADLLVRGAFFLIRFASGRWRLARV